MVHCLGILTSMFWAVFVSRGIVELIYGRQKKLDKISIGQVWRPQAPRPQPTHCPRAPTGPPGDRIDPDRRFYDGIFQDQRDIPFMRHALVVQRHLAA